MAFMLVACFFALLVQFANGTPIFNYKKFNTSQNGLEFAIIGDFGSKLAFPHHKNQDIVSVGLSEYAKSNNMSFVISTGDQIYMDGLSFDDETYRQKQIKEIFEDVYVKDFPSLNVPWLLTLGNHDCRGSIPGVIEYSAKNDSLWYFPSPYFSEDVLVDNATVLKIINLNSCDIVCGLNDPDCEDQIPRPPLPVIMDQIKWFADTLANADNSAKAKFPHLNIKYVWKVVVGHFPVFSYSKHNNGQVMNAVIKPLLEKYKVHAFLNGHDHIMQHIREKESNSDWKPHYLISGSGGYELHTINEGPTPNLLRAYENFGFISANINKNSFIVTFRDSGGNAINHYRIAYDCSSSIKGEGTRFKNMVEKQSEIGKQVKTNFLYEKSVLKQKFLNEKSALKRASLNFLSEKEFKNKLKKLTRKYLNDLHWLKMKYERIVENYNHSDDAEGNNFSEINYVHKEAI